MRAALALVVSLVANGERISEVAVRAPWQASLMQKGMARQAGAQFSSLPWSSGKYSESPRIEDKGRVIRIDEAQDMVGWGMDIEEWKRMETMTLEDVRHASFLRPRDNETLHNSRHAKSRRRRRKTISETSEAEKDWPKQAVISDWLADTEREPDAELQEERAPACGVLWYYHIGKCAGTSGYAWLKQLEALGSLDAILDIEPPSEGGGHVTLEMIDQQLQPLISNITGKMVAVHHHHNGPGLYGTDDYFFRLQTHLQSQGCSLTRFTLLREPAQRLISHVNFVMWMQHPNLTAIHKATRDQFFRQKLSPSNVNLGDDQYENQYDNYQVRYLLNNFQPQGSFLMPFGAANKPALDAAIHILEGFEVVGIVEEVEESVSKVINLLGFPSLRFPITNVRKKPYHEHDKDPFPADVLALMEARTRLEQKLYDKYSNKRLP